MRLEEHFTFGKYKGLKLTEVYQGSKKINPQLLKGYALDKIASADVTYKDILLTEIMNFEISDTLMRVTPVQDDFEGNWTQALERLFRNGKGYVDYVIGNLNIDEYNTKTYALEKGRAEVAGGQPEYIRWCILNVDNFYIEPVELIKLQMLDVYRFTGIQVLFKIEDIYEYHAKIEIDSFQFAPVIIDINQKKYDSLTNKK